MYLGNLAQDLQHGYDNLKAVMRQAPWETASSLIKGLESGSIKNAVIHSTVKNTVKFARGNWLDKGAVWGTFVGEVLQLGFAEGDFAKAGEMSNIVKAGTQAEKISGSYLLEFQSGKFYAGKGLEPRMMQSIKHIETTYGDKLLNNQFFPASSTRGAFINEHKLMMQFGGPKSFDKLSPTYNLIFSPGKKLGGF